jgi:hypothetical protein
MNKIVVIIVMATTFLFVSCEKEYMCVCKDLHSGQITNGDKVKTTKLGKKGFEQSCKSNSTEHKECVVE